MQPKPLRLLLIGPFPPPIGGITVLFKFLAEYLRERDDLKTTIVDIKGICGGILGLSRHFLYAAYKIIQEIRSVDVVSLHAATTVFPLMAPFVVILGKLFRKPVILRKFGGTDYQDYDVLRRILIHWAVKRTDLYLVETKMLVASSKKNGIKHSEWFPNNRPLTKMEVSFEDKKNCSRFVYMGHVRYVKGINEIIQAAERFDQGVSVDIYGPLLDDFTEEGFVGLKNVYYRGVVAPEEVVETLSRYDALLLPTYHPGEGYPGVILEAYNARLPIVCSNWRALPEIVDETCGIIIEPQDVDGLYIAMKRLVDNEQLFISLCKGVEKQQGKFSTEVWNDRFVEHCVSLTNRN